MYRQIEEWKGNCLNEEEYGFKRTPRGFMPVADEENRSTGTIKNYEMLLQNFCTCNKYGVTCTNMGVAESHT